MQVFVRVRKENRSFQIFDFFLKKKIEKYRTEMKDFPVSLEDDKRGQGLFLS